MLPECASNYHRAPMSYFRTPEHRKLRAELIRRWKPWEQSTGPKSAEDKARSRIVQKLEQDGHAALR